MLPPQYDVAMKLASLRQYKYDMSDIVGIIHSEHLTKESIEKAIADLYVGFDKLSHPEEAKKLLENIFSGDNLETLYESTRKEETTNRVVLKELDEDYPTLLNEGNIESVLAAAKKKKEGQ